MFFKYSEETTRVDKEDIEQFAFCWLRKERLEKNGNVYSREMEGAALAALSWLSSFLFLFVLCCASHELCHIFWLIYAFYLAVFKFAPSCGISIMAQEYKSPWKLLHVD